MRCRDIPSAPVNTVGMLRSFLVVLFVAVTAAPVLAQERDPGERQSLLDLAYALGESHALRQVCEGTGDQYWRARMLRLAEVEQAEPAFDAQLRERFNVGFAARRGEFSQCDAASRQAQQQAAHKGQALALKLSQAVRRVRQIPIDPEGLTPDSMADSAAPR